MKKIFALYIIAILYYPAQAQRILFEDNFDSYLNYKFGNGWVNNPSWLPGIMYLVVGSADTACLCNESPDVLSFQKVAGLSDCAKSNLLPFNAQPKPNELLYSSKINLTSVNRAWLKYDSYFKKGFYDGKYEDGYVQLSINGGINWTTLQTVPRNQSMSSMQTYYIDITPYVGFPDVRIGFRYIDNNLQVGGWAIDNVEVFEPMANDLKLITFSPEDTVKGFAAINTGYMHTYTVQNMGYDTISNFVVKYKQSNGDVKIDSVKNVSIAPFATYSYAHNIPDTITSLDVHQVVAWVELAGDTIHWNDTLKSSLRGAQFLPKKMVLLEEGTGTWHYQCPRGHVYMQQLKNANLNVCQIAVHDTDPMSIETYNDYLYNLRQIFIPYFLIDRHIIATPDSLIDIVKKEQTNFGFADIKLSSYTYPERFLLKAVITPAINMSGDFRVIVVLTENHVSGVDSGWEQANYYAGGKKGIMGGYENKPDPVPAADMLYEFVARNISPTPEGKNNLPKTIFSNQQYTIDFDIPLSKKWNSNNMNASVFLLRNDDSTILNASQIPFMLNIKSYENIDGFNAILYPNPTNDNTTLRFYLLENEKLNITITDITGKTIMSFSETEYYRGENEILIHTFSLANGVYIVSLNSQTTRQALKLQVVH